jgi:DUF4097 and DUF4098 domain-containing protein YvlB
MKKWIKRILRIAGLLIAVGIIAAIIGFAVSGFDLGDVAGNTYETRKAIFTTGKNIERIVMDFDTTDITVEYSKTAENIEITYEVKHTKGGEPLTKVTERDENGIISFVEKTSWKGHINLFDFHEMKATVTLPENYSTVLDFETDTGDIRVKGAKVTSRVEFSTDTGDMELYSVRCESLCTESDTGEQGLEDVIVNGTAQLKSSSGDIDLLSFDAEEIFIKASTGDVFGILLSEKKFDVDSSTGDIRVPQDGDGGLCEIRTSTGDIEMKIQ